MAYTKAQLEAIKNTLLASNQPILASQHRSQIQSMIDEMYDSQSRGNILVGVQSDTVQGGSDTFLIFRSGQAYQIPLSLFSATTLAGLGDVFISDVQNGDSIVYNTVNNRWENQNILLEFAIFNLSDVELTSLTNGDILRYDSVSQKWENESLATILSPYALLTDLDDYQLLSEKGQANGYAQLDTGAKIPTSIIPDSVLGQVEYKGTWNASTNTPTLPSTPVKKGDYYVVSVGGTQFGIDFLVGDWIISNGLIWEKVDNTDAVTSVFGRLGNVVANATDYNSFYVRHDTNAQGLNTTQQGNARTNIAAIGGAGTAGQVSFWTGAGVQSGDSGLVWDNVGKNLNIAVSNGKINIGLQNSNRGLLNLSNAGGSTIINLKRNNASTVGGKALIEVVDSNNNAVSSIAFFGEGVDNSGRIEFRTDNNSAQDNGYSVPLRWSILSTGIFQSNGAQTIQTSGTEALTLQGNGGNTILNPTAGNVLVGTTVNDPRNFITGNYGIKLEKNLSEFASDIVVFNRTSSTNGNILQFRRNGLQVGSIDVTTEATSYSTSNNSGINGVDINTVAIRTNNLERLRIDSAGNVGIGTSSPNAKLQVAGPEIILDNGVNGRLTFTVNNASENRLLSTTSGFAAYRPIRYFATQHIFADGSAERMRIDSAGNVGIGTTAPSERLHVAGNILVGTRANATGNFATFSATGVLQERTAAEVVTDLNLVTINTTQTITGAKTFSLDAVINGVNVGRGGGNISSNTISGRQAGLNNTTGSANSFFGDLAGRDNTVGTNNSFFGYFSGVFNTSANENSFFGSGSGQDNITGSANSFFGRLSGSNNTTGNDNSFFGTGSGLNNTTGNNNIFIGKESGYNNTIGNNNIFIGREAGLNSTNNNNSFFGDLAGRNITTGFRNSFFGMDAGRRILNGSNLTIANNSVFLGSDTRSNANNETNQIVIGDTAIGAGSNTATLGNTSILKTILRGTINAANLPTSSSGLITGDIWNNGGVLNIV